MQVNGEDAATVIERRNLVFSSHQDADAQWNGGMPNYAAQRAVNLIADSLDYTGSSLTLTYDNGDEITQESVAAVREDFSGVNSGEDFYNRFCSPDG